MTPDIEKLIDLAIADGEITEQERKVILKKAIENGFDEDEVIVTLEGRLHQMKATHNKNGIIKTCPACGGHVKSFRINCDDCGHEFRDTNSSNNVKEFHLKIVKASQKDRASIIQTFPIPTNKEDIIEFLTISIASATPMTQEEQISYTHPLKGINEEGGHRLSEISAWQNKSNMVLRQAKTIFARDVSMTTILNNYESQLNNNLQKQIRKKRKYIIGISVGILVLLLFVGFMALTESNGEQKETERLSNIELQINNAIEAKNYNKALILNEQLVWSWELNYPESQKKALQYEERRESYKKAIEKIQINK